MPKKTGRKAKPAPAPKRAQRRIPKFSRKVFLSKADRRKMREKRTKSRRKRRTR